MLPSAVQYPTIPVNKSWNLSEISSKAGSYYIQTVWPETISKYAPPISCQDISKYWHNIIVTIASRAGESALHPPISASQQLLRSPNVCQLSHLRESSAWMKQSHHLPPDMQTMKADVQCVGSLQTSWWMSALLSPENC